MPRTRERLIFSDAEYPAGTRCELARAQEAEAALARRAVHTRAGVVSGELRVVRLGGRLRVVAAAALTLESA